MLRAILSAVSWSRGTKGPSRVISTRAEGVLRAIRALESAHPPLPRHLLELRERLEGCEPDHVGSTDAAKLPGPQSR